MNFYTATGPWWLSQIHSQKARVNFLVLVGCSHLQAHMEMQHLSHTNHFIMKPALYARTLRFTFTIWGRRRTNISPVTLLSDSMPFSSWQKERKSLKLQQTVFSWSSNSPETDRCPVYFQESGKGSPSFTQIAAIASHSTVSYNRQQISRHIVATVKKWCCICMKEVNNAKLIEIQREPTS